MMSEEKVGMSQRCGKRPSSLRTLGLDVMKTIYALVGDARSGARHR